MFRWLIPVVPVGMFALVVKVLAHRAEASTEYHERIKRILDKQLPRENAEELWRTNREGMVQ